MVDWASGLRSCINLRTLLSTTACQKLFRHEVCPPSSSLHFLPNGGKFALHGALLPGPLAEGYCVALTVAWWHINSRQPSMHFACCFIARFKLSFKRPSADRRPSALSRCLMHGTSPNRATLC
jgi:hypothetical protein